MGKKQDGRVAPVLDVDLSTAIVPGNAVEKQMRGIDAETQRPASIASTANTSQRWSSGSWRGKAGAVAEIARESINAAADTGRPKGSPTTSAQRLSRSLKTTGRSTHSPPSISGLSIRGDEQQKDGSPNPPPDTQLSNDPALETGKTYMLSGSSEVDSAASSRAPQSIERPLPASGWKGWWGRPEDVEGDDVTGIKDPRAVEVNRDSKISIPGDGSKETVVTSSSKIVDDDGTASFQPVGNDPKTGSTAQTQDKSAHRSSWFGLWGSAQVVELEARGHNNPQKASLAEPSHTGISPSRSRTGVVPEIVTQKPQSADKSSQSSGTWAFWSKETAKATTSEALSAQLSKQPQIEIGELAIAKAQSESSPKPGKLVPLENVNDNGSPGASRKRARPKSDVSDGVQALKKVSSNKQSYSNSVATKSSDLNKDASKSADEKAKTPQEQKTMSKSQPSRTSNLLLPAFRETYHVVESPSSYWQQIAALFGRSAHSDGRHLSISPTPPRIQRPLAIGVHGYFPTPLVQKVLGPPTGTSSRFAAGAAAAIQKWTHDRGYSCEVQKVALEGEGMVADRVDALWKLLLNWIDEIRKADFIMFGCHSQGVPVTIMLVAKLISFGCLSSSARIGICGMAGVNLGPFSSYQSRFLGGIAGELFDFSRSDSTVSKAYSSALQVTLDHHVRVLYVGSIDDQLVSLESSTFSSNNHPYIYRAVFVDGRIHAPDFLTRLVGFTLKLRNLGIPDHGLIRELSGPLAGSLYTGEGHSRIYEDPAVYDLAVELALETSTLPTSMPLDIKPYEVPSASAANPYFLPWAMRGILEEDFVKTELKEETGELLKLFDGWKPQSKVLKDVKFRLEAVKSKL